MSVILKKTIKYSPDRKWYTGEMDRPGKKCFTPVGHFDNYIHLTEQEYLDALGNTENWKGQTVKSNPMCTYESERQFSKTRENKSIPNDAVLFPWCETFRMITRIMSGEFFFDQDVPYRCQKSWNTRYGERRAIPTTFDEEEDKLALVIKYRQGDEFRLHAHDYGDSLILGEDIKQALCAEDPVLYETYLWLKQKRDPYDENEAKRRKRLPEEWKTDPNATNTPAGGYTLTEIAKKLGIERKALYERRERIRAVLRPLKEDYGIFTYINIEEYKCNQKRKMLPTRHKSNARTCTTNMLKPVLGDTRTSLEKALRKQSTVSVLSQGTGAVRSSCWPWLRPTDVAKSISIYSQVALLPIFS